MLINANSARVQSTHNLDPVREELNYKTQVVINRIMDIIEAAICDSIARGDYVADVSIGGGFVGNYGRKIHVNMNHQSRDIEIKYYKEVDIFEVADRISLILKENEYSISRDFPFCSDVRFTIKWN